MDFELAGKLFNAYGLPMTLLAFMVWGVYRSVGAAWDFLKPLILQVFEKHISLIDTVIAKANKVDRIEEATDKCLDGHDVTHKKLDSVGADVKKLLTEK